MYAKRILSKVSKVQEIVELVEEMIDVMLMSMEEQRRVMELRRSFSMYTSVDVLAGGFVRLKKIKDEIKHNERQEKKTYFFISAVRTDGKFCRRSSSLVNERENVNEKVRINFIGHTFEI